RAQDNGKRKRAAESLLSSDRSAGEIAVGGDIGDPGRLSVRPDPARQADAAWKHLLSCAGLELGELHWGTGPDIGAAEYLPLLVESPKSTFVPVKAFANRLQQARRSLAQGGGLGQDRGNRIPRRLP